MPKSPSVKTSTSPRRKQRVPATIGIDLGGTKVGVALVDHEGRLLREVRRETVPEELASSGQVKRHIDYVVRAMVDAASELVEASPGYQITGVGLASAGPMNIEKGTLDRPSNFRGWKIVPIVALLSKGLIRAGILEKVSFQNDAIAAALGEGWVGRARDVRTYAMITVGTGIGTGVILNGRPAQSGGMGSEWGHLIVHSAGLNGDRGSFDARSVEGIASGTGLVRRARLAGLQCGNAHELVELARQGNSVARALFADASEALAALFYSLSLGFHLEKIVVSGGMLAVKDLFLPQATEIYRDLMRAKNPAFLAPVQSAQLGTKAGVIGAARLPHLNHLNHLPPRRNAAPRNDRKGTRT